MHMHARPPHKVLMLAIVLTISFALIEAIAGFFANSLTLLSDAGHMASDSLALGIAAFAAWLASKPASNRHTYGFGRAEVIAAWLSALLMVVLSIAIIIEAIHRFKQPEAVSGGLVMFTAFIGLLINVYIAWLLSKSERTLNIRAAMLHVLGDILGSVAAIISGAVIYYTHWMAIDPILSIVIAVLILLSSIKLLQESMSVLMEGVPPHIDVATVKHHMCDLDSVVSVHDLHVWTLSSGTIILSAHIVLEHIEHWNTVLNQLRLMLRDRYHIEHVTLQPEIHLSAWTDQENPCACPDSPNNEDHHHG